MKTLSKKTSRTRGSWKAALPALALTIALSPDGSGEEPPRLGGASAPQLDASTPHLGTAIAEQRNLASARPNDAGVWNDLGNLLAVSGSLDEAESAYARALELDPGSVQALFNLGLLRQQRGDLAGAVSEYTELLAIEPGHAWAQYQLGAAYDALGERELAVARYAEAFTLDPELLFAEKNPHVIENQLVTEALLRARRGSRAAPRAPRAYDEEARINSILTPRTGGDQSQAAGNAGRDDSDRRAEHRRCAARSDRSRRGAARADRSVRHRGRHAQGAGARLGRSAREREQPGSRQCRRRGRARGAEHAAPLGRDGHAAEPVARRSHSLRPTTAAARSESASARPARSSGSSGPPRTSRRPRVSRRGAAQPIRR